MTSEEVITLKKKKKRTTKQPAHEEEPVYLDQDLDEEEKDEINSLFKAKQASLQPVKKKKKTLELDNTNVSVEQSSLDYLTEWQDNRDKWKFRKVRQTWLLQNMYDRTVIDKEYFKILLKYLEELKGQSRQSSVDQAQKILEEEEADTKKLKRATKILQVLA